ncbi:MAG TPA: hypothetical protein VGQ13_05750 [Nitrososphaera sp.]|jgi:hypothetical protein|nr:hypothetical protein [Nitrososphaera sp.]
MTISFKVWIGLAIAMVGLSGLVYAIPIFARATASHDLVFKEADVPPFTENMKAYIALELASAGTLALGIAIMALGHADTFDKGKDVVSSKDTETIRDSKSNVAGAA